MDAPRQPRIGSLRATRLQGPDSFRIVMRKGRKTREHPLSMRHYQGDEVDQSRVGFIIRKKVGKAVLRNAIRRVLRERFRARLGEFRNPVWVVFDVMNEASDSTRRQVRESADKLLSSLC